MTVVTYQEITQELEEKLSTELTADALRRTLSVVNEVLAVYDITKQDVETIGNDYLVDAYIEAKTVEGRSQLTLTRYKYVLDRFFTAKKIDSRHTTAYHIRQYLAEEQARGISDSTRKGIREIFSGYFNWLHRDGLITRNPMANILPIKCEKKVKEVFTDCELERLKMTHTTPRNKAIVYFLKATGCRVGEVEKLNRDDIDLVNMMCVVHGKGNKHRKVFFDPVTAMVLDEYLKTRTDDNPALFIGKTGMRLRPDGMRIMLNKLGAASLVNHVHPHKFRRTELTHLSSKGMPIEQVRVFAGHEKIDTTLGYVVIDSEQVQNSYKIYA